MPRLYQRYCKLTIGMLAIEGGNVPSLSGFVTSGFHISFNVRKTFKLEFNTGQIHVSNLNEEHRKILDNSGQWPVTLEAGYGNTTGVIFKGESRTIDHEYIQPNWDTHIQLSDGWGTQAKATTISFAPGTPIAVVISKLLTDLQLPAGNLLTNALSKIKQQQFPHGITFHGNSLNLLNTLLRNNGLTLSIQDGVPLAVNDIPDPQSLIPIISPETGLIGSPTHKRWVPAWPTFTKFKCLLNPALKVNNQIILRSQYMSESVRVIKAVTHIGNTAGKEWYSECECT